MLMGYTNPFCYFLFFIFLKFCLKTHKLISAILEKKGRGLDVRKPFKFQFLRWPEKGETFKLGWQFLSCRGNPHGDLSGWGTVLHWAAQKQWTEGTRCLPCPWLLSLLLGVSSLLLQLDGGSWLCWEPEACRSLPHSQEYFTSLNGKEPKAVGGKQAKHSFMLREWLAQGRRWVVRMPKKGSSKERGVMALTHALCVVG